MKIYSVFQPIVHLKSKEVMGYEALLRGVGAPEKLFRNAMRKGKVTELDCAARNLALDSFCGPEKLFLNCHPISFAKGIDLNIQDHPNIQPRQLVLEITEQRMLDTRHIHHQVKRLKQEGILLAIDDFGHGFTNLSLVESLEPDYIKLDRTLIKNIFNPKVQQLLKGIKKLAIEISSFLIAEGIETAEQCQIVQECGITIGQGWYLGRPIQFSHARQMVSPI